MRTKNFFKGLAVAAVALVGVFATSCSEEELNVDTNGNWTPVDKTELPAASASIALSVVDLGDAGVDAKVLYTETLDATAKIGQSMTIECPAEKYDADLSVYTVAAAQTINIPAIQKGQAVVIPVTFYVTKFTSAYAAVKCEEKSTEPMDDLVIEYNKDGEKWKNESNYTIDFAAKVPFELGLFEIATPSARAAATTNDEIIEGFWAKKMATSKQMDYSIKYGYELRAWAYPLFTIQIYREKVVYAVTYGDTTKEFNVENRYYGWVGSYKELPIPGHEQAYDHYHGHGYDPNAGGGVTTWE